MLQIGLKRGAAVYADKLPEVRNGKVFENNLMDYRLYLPVFVTFTAIN